MKKKLQKLLKNQKGLTLIELLAVVVILGIIAAIAVPSIANIIDNSKKDAHVANAEQMIGAARLAIAANDKDIIADSILTLKELTANGYIESNLKDPDTDGYYNQTEALVKVIGLGTANVTYKVTLKGQERGIKGVKAGELDRADVKKSNKANNETSGNNGKGNTDSENDDIGNTDNENDDNDSTGSENDDIGNIDNENDDNDNIDTEEGKQSEENDSRNVYEYAKFIDQNIEGDAIFKTITGGIKGSTLEISGDAIFETITGGIKGKSVLHIGGNATFKTITGKIRNSVLHIGGDLTFNTPIEATDIVGDSIICVGGTIKGISGKSNRIFPIANCPAPQN